MEPRRIFLGTLVALGTVVGAYVLFRLLGLILTLYGAIIVASAIKPLADRLVARRVPRALSILLLYLVAVLVLIVAGLIIVPPLAREATVLLERGPELIDQAQRTVQNVLSPLGATLPTLDLGELAREAAARLPGLASGVLAVTISAFTAVFGLVFLLVIALYWSLERDRVLGFAFGFLTPERRERAHEVWCEIEDKMGAYVRGQLILGVAVGSLAYVGLKLLGVPFTLVLAIIAGLTELIPNIGPFIGAVPAVIVAFAESPTKGLLVAALYVLIQQLENNLLVPKVMERAVGMSPLVVILSVLAGGSLLGVVGAILAVPTAAIIKVVLDRVLLHRTAAFDERAAKGAESRLGTGAETTEVRTG